MQKGFTFIELSIVLVIIGLLIGGILVGQSLIESVKANAEIRRISEWSIAIINFQQKFKQEAGDSNRFIPGGNNDHDTYDYANTCPTSLFVESDASWSHLSKSKMLREVYTWNSINFCQNKFQSIQPYINMPIEYGVQQARSQLLVNPLGYLIENKKYYRALSVNLPYQIMWSIDHKIDDGNTNSGLINSNTYEGYDCDVSGIGNDVSATGVSINDVICSGEIFFSPSSAPELPIIIN